MYRGRTINTALKRQERKGRGFECNAGETWAKIIEEF
jgi:hypothetical protein